MSMIHALLLGILPAILLVWAGSLVRAATAGEKGATRWLLFLLGVLTLLLTALAIAMSASSRASSFLSMALLPVTCGTLAALFLHFLSNRMVWSRDTVKIFFLFLIVVVLFIWLGTVGDSTVSVLITIGGVLLALVWQAWNWTGRWYLAAWAVQTILLCVSIWATDANIPLIETPAWLSFIVQIAIVPLIPGIAIVVAARLVYMSQVGDQSADWRKVGLILLLVASILLLIGYQIALASIWDVATDGLGGIFLWVLVSVAGIATAMVLAWFLPGKRKLVALAFALVVPVSMLCAFRLGTYGPYGQWGMSPIVATERRAETVNRAIQRYHEQNGDYPRALSDLTPWHLVYIPNPLIIPGQTWCYEGGHNYYRLGYVYRQYFSTPASVRVHAAVGEPPVSDWACEDEAAKYPAPPGYYGP